MQRELTGSFFFRTFLAATLLSAALLPAVAQNRIVSAMDGNERVAMRGNVHPFARPDFDNGKASGSMMLYRMVLMFRPSAAQQADLEALLSEQQNPLSPYYHQWLTPEQYAERFGLSEGDVAKVAAWLQAQGFTVDETARSRTYVAFSGSAAQVELAFGTAIHRYTVNGELHYANVSEPLLPAALANVALALHNLHDFRPKARGGVGRTSPHPQFTSSISGNHFIAPDDFATIFDLNPLYSSGIDGTGQKLAVMGQTDLIMSDIATFRSISGLPANTPTVVLVPGSADPGVVNSDIGEADLDVEWSGAVARNATIIYVNSKNGAFDSLNHAIVTNVAPVISISYGDCEANFSTAEVTALTAMGQQANAQGQTIVGPAGDSGAADCDFPPNATTKVTSATHGLAVDIPAALVFVTGAGGTTFNDGADSFWTTLNTSSNASAISYIPETTWNDTAFEIANAGSLAATGGGVSKLFAKPTWQTGAGVPADGQRDVPDIAFPASFDHDGYLMCSQGNCVNGFRQANGNLLVVGGTSAGAPVFAGIVALINQHMNAAQGNVNPRLYQLAGTSPDAFHDITSGDNKVPCTAGSTGCPTGGSIGFSAGVGYDLVTGLGSVDAYNLVMEWPANGAPPPRFTVTAAASAPNQYNVSVAPVNGFNGTVNLSVGGLPVGATANFLPSSVAISGAAAQGATLQVATGLGTPAGTFTLAVTGSGGNVTQSAAAIATLAAGPDFQLAASPASLTLTAGSTSARTGTSTLTVSALNGFTGTVALSCTVSSSLPGTTCAVSAGSINTSGTVTVTVNAPTTRASLHAPRALPRFFPWPDGTFALAIGLMFVGDGSSKRKLRLALLAALLVIGLAMMAGCGGGGGSSAASANSTTTTFTAQSGTVTVQGTNSGLTRSSNAITVTVN